MNRVKHLDALWCSARKQYVRMRVRVLALAGHTSEVKSTLPLLVIDGLNCWANFTRAYYLSVALGCRSRNGVRLQSGLAPRTERRAIEIAVTAAAPSNASRVPLAGPINRRLEPAWHDPNVLIQCAQAASLPTAVDVVGAFSPFPEPIRDWACVRNFFAHRNGHTHGAALKTLARYGVTSSGDVLLSLMQPTFRRSRPLIWEWCFEFEDRCEFLCT